MILFYISILILWTVTTTLCYMFDVMKCDTFANVFLLLFSMSPVIISMHFNLQGFAFTSLALNI